MTIDEAIKIFTQLPETYAIIEESSDGKAIKLGIEALKEVARARRLGPPLKDWRLPGETEE